MRVISTVLALYAPKLSPCTDGNKHFFISCVDGWSAFLTLMDGGSKLGVVEVKLKIFPEDKCSVSPKANMVFELKRHVCFNMILREKLC